MRDYFVLGCKLFGVYCLFLSIPHIAAAIPALYTPNELSGDYAKITLLTRLVILFIPIGYVGIGLYLLKDGKLVHDFAYSVSGSVDSKNNRDKFNLFLKMLGMFLIGTYFPGLLKSISNFLVYANAPDIFDLLKEKQYFYVNFLPSLGGVVFGFYLLKSGDIFIKIALNNGRTSSDTE